MSKKDQLDLDQFELLESIGSGAYGSVQKIRNKKNEKLYAAKILKTKSNEIDDQDKSFKRELRCHQTLDNPAVIKFIGYSMTDFDGNKYPVFITKYMEKGCLRGVLDLVRKKKPPKGWNNTKMIINILGISLGMKYLHDNGIIHRDLKPSNILLDKNLYPKLTDFGTARHLDVNSKNMTHTIGTPIYMAPEISEEETNYTFKVDVFSFAMVLYEFYSNTPPRVKGGSSFQVIRNITKGQRPDETKLSEEPIKELVKKCWSKSDVERPSFDEIIKAYTEQKDIYWPDDVDEKEIETYLNKFGLSLDKDKIVEFFIKHTRKTGKSLIDTDDEDDEDTESNSSVKEKKDDGDEDSESNSDDSSPKSKSKSKKKPIDSEDSEIDSEEDDGPIKSKSELKPKPTKKKVIDSDDDEDEDEPIKSKSKSKPKVKSTKKKVIDSDEDEEDEDEPIKSKSKSKPKVKSTKKKVVDSDDDEDEDEPIKSKSKSKPKVKSTKKKVVDSDEEDDEPIKRKGKSKSKSSKSKKKSDDEDSDEKEKIQAITSMIQLRSLLCRNVQHNKYVPKECKEMTIKNLTKYISKLDNKSQQIFNKATKYNDPTALYYLASSFLEGLDPFDSDKFYAFKYMKEAAVQGNPKAFYGLAFMMAPRSLKKKDDEDEERSKNFIKMLKIATEFGNELAAFVLGQLYISGFYVKENYVMSLVYIKYAADKKLPSAMLMYATRLRKIANSEIDDDELTDLKDKCADILNDTSDYGNKSNQLRLTATRLFATIEDPRLADLVSRVYYQKVIDCDKSSKEQKKSAKSNLKKLSKNETVEDFDEDKYRDILCKTIVHR